MELAIGEPDVAHRLAPATDQRGGKPIGVTGRQHRFSSYCHSKIQRFRYSTLAAALSSVCAHD